MPAPQFSIDAFHRGRFHLVQWKGRGHRAGLDALLLAAAVPAGFSGTVADLGAGAGAAGLAVAARSPEARVTLVENSSDMICCARQSIALPQNASLSGRVSILEADVTLAGRARVAAGLADNAFDFVLTNPPFNDPRARPSPDPLRASAHAMPSGGLATWIRTAAAIVRPDGFLAMIARPEALQEILAAMAGRFGAIDLLPVHTHPRKDAIRIVLRARKGSRRGLALRPGLQVHAAEGSAPTPEALRLLNGDADLFPN